MNTDTRLMQRVRPGAVRASARSGRPLVAGVLFTASVALLRVAMYLKPASEGFGTHQGLGLPPCGFVLKFNMPCMTCGMTTSYSLAVRGRLWASFTNQPMGAVLAVMTAMCALVSGWALIARLDLLPLIEALWTPRHLLIGGVMFAAAWIYKILLFRGLIG